MVQTKVDARHDVWATLQTVCQTVKTWQDTKFSEVTICNIDAWNHFIIMLFHFYPPNMEKVAGLVCHPDHYIRCCQKMCKLIRGGSCRSFQMTTRCSNHIQLLQFDTISASAQIQTWLQTADYLRSVLPERNRILTNLDIKIDNVSKFVPLLVQLSSESVKVSILLQINTNYLIL